MSLHKITFLPFKRSVDANSGDTILDAALRADVPLEHVCGGSCSCSTCHVIIQEGFEFLGSPSDDEIEQLSEVGKRLSATSRLACQTEINSDLIVQVPGMWVV